MAGKKELAKKIIESFNTFKISHVRREKNTDADKLSKQAASLGTGQY